MPMDGSSVSATSKTHCHNLFHLLLNSLFDFFVGYCNSTEFTCFCAQWIWMEKFILHDRMFILYNIFYVLPSPNKWTAWIRICFLHFFILSWHFFIDFDALVTKIMGIFRRYTAQFSPALIKHWEESILFWGLTYTRDQMKE